MSRWDEDLKNDFEYHKPNDLKVKYHAIVRKECYDLADVIKDYVPESKEREEALKLLNMVMMWANAGLARNEIKED